MREELKVTSPEDYAILAAQAEAAEEKDPGQLVKLPHSKAVARLRRITPEESMNAPLAMSLVRKVTGEAARRDPEELEEEVGDARLTKEQRDENIAALVEMRITVVEHCVEPRLGLNEKAQVCLIDKDGKPIVRIYKKDFYYMWRWITGQEAEDGLDNFRNRQERRAFASKSKRSALRNGSKPPVEDGSAAA